VQRLGIEVPETVVTVEAAEIEGERSRWFRSLVESNLAEVWLRPHRLVLDLAGVRSMDASAVAVLVRARARLVPWGGVLEIRNVCPAVRSVIDLLGLAERLGVVVDDEPAPDLLTPR
jgi:anti-anti-sigma factor